MCCCRPDEGRTEEELADELPLDKDKDNEESEMIYGEDGKLHPRNEKHEEKPAEEQPGEAQAAEKPAEETHADEKEKEKDLQFKPLPQFVPPPAAPQSNLEPATTTSSHVRTHCS